MISVKIPSSRQQGVRQSLMPLRSQSLIPIIVTQGTWRGAENSLI